MAKARPKHSKSLDSEHSSAQASSEEHAGTSQQISQICGILWTGAIVRCLAKNWPGGGPIETPLSEPGGLWQGTDGDLQTIQEEMRSETREKM